MDQDDLETITRNFTNLNENNNKQLITNELITNRINNITNAMNLISYSLWKDDRITARL